MWVRIPLGAYALRQGILSTIVSLDPGVVNGYPELPSSTDLPYFIRKSVINTEVRIPVIKYGNMKIQTCVYIAATVANILHALRASFNS